MNKLELTDEELNVLQLALSFLLMNIDKAQDDHGVSVETQDVEALETKLYELSGD